MFWRKKSSSSSSERPVSAFQSQPSEPPKPILRMNTEGQGISSIRFAGGTSTSNSSGKASSPVKPTFPVRANTSPATYGSSPNPNQNQNGEMSTERVRSHTQPPAPRVIVSSYDSYSSPTVQPHQRMASYDSSPLSSQPKMVSSRRSSRPTSPGTSSFGARIRSRTEPTPSPTFNRSPSPAHSSPLSEAGPLETPPMPSSHVTTPPTAYVSSFQSRAPPPPSPYRPTNERRRSSLTRNLPENLPRMNDFAPSIHVEESLLASDSRSSVFTLPPGPDVPMLNIIPATPQNQGEEFSAIWEQHYPSASSSSTSTGLEEAVKLEEISLENNVILEEVEQEISDAPSIDVELDFSPFSPLAELPNTDDTPLEEIREYITAEDLERFDYQEEQQVGSIQEEDGEEEYFGEEHDAPSEPLPPSPPFMSYPSLPSLSSHSHDGEHDNDNDHGSIRSSLSGSGSESDCSIQTSSSMSSLVSFPDVEEALGSMLASLSDSSMASTAINTPTKDQSVNSVYHVNVNANHGLGLGLGMGMNDSQSFITSSTAPLAPSPRRRAPPPPLDLTSVKSKNRRSLSKRESMIHSAPIINHRVAFYGTAKVHPNSPCSGIFTGSSSSSSSLASSGSSSSTISLNQQQITPSAYHHKSHSYRDSISLASEASDEDLCTASIISLTPVMQGKVAGREMKEEIMVERDGENVLRLGLGLGLEFGGGEFGRSGIEQQEEENVEVGLAL
ncbi:hypothetical protein I302_107544 [Kwoniella bestiolae CBS 10118]|uniref:Uncharacterized protein n=1 Tax=Kwoniella bestiolae CBS 10118 TaxID=1296100 RepID=A0A1B9FY92_9TREE|nr:hypothetical protein I302_06714 [Kwoniella bestiolae CBS 10118]OCF23731.1 hypothetical protein I302_06714 [Kwoniella bestiolae CBS 10118]